MPTLAAGQRWAVDVWAVTVHSVPASRVLPCIRHLRRKPRHWREKLLGARRMTRPGWIRSNAAILGTGLTAGSLECYEADICQFNLKSRNSGPGYSTYDDMNKSTQISNTLLAQGVRS
jgi:hypothetical protein